MRCHHLGFVVVFSMTLVETSAADFIAPPTPTFRNELETAKVVLFGRLENARMKDAAGAGETDLVVLDVIRRHPLLRDPKSIVLNRFLPVEKGAPSTFIVFARITKGQLEVYSGKPLSAAGPDYLRGILKLDDKKPAEMLRYYLNHLEHKDGVIADDAYQELVRSRTTDSLAAARGYSSEKLWAWIRDPKVPMPRRDYYAYLLAACGKADDADAIVKWTNQEDIKGKPVGHAVFAVLSLNPKKYLSHYKTIAHNEKTPFLERYRILVSVRALREANLGAVPRAVCEDFVAGYLDQSDMADFVIEDFRKWKRWDLTERILGMYGKKPFDIPIMRRAILRFALQAPGEKAAAFVAALRKKDAPFVEDTEELLKLAEGGGK